MIKSTAKSKKLKKRRNWRILSAKDFDSLMHPCFFMCWLVGYFPYNCKPPTYSLSKTRFAFSTFLMFVYSILLFFMIYGVNFTALVNIDVPETLNSNLYLFLDGIVIVILYFLTGARLSLLQNLSKTSTMLSAKDFNKLAKVIHTKDIVGFLFLVAHLPNCFKSNTYLTVRNCTSLYIMLVNYSMDMFYMNCVCTLKACFEKMNECIRELRKPRANDDPWAQTFVHYGQKDLLLLTKLKHFQEKHSEISDMVQLVNNTFMIRTIILAATTFTVVTFNLYFFIYYSHVDLPLNVKFWYKQYISPASFYFVKFAVMIWACETAVNQAKQIKTTLYDVFSDTTDPVTKREVELFSLQILHRNNIFTAKAIDMNAIFLTRIVGGITMYIIILIQFLLYYVVCMLLKEG